MSDKDKISDAYKKFADDLEEIEEKDKEKRKEVLKKGVKDLEQEYMEEIKSTHAVDARLVKLRQEADMPELIGVGDIVEKKRFKDKEKFEEFLAKEVLEVGIEESRPNGGVMIFADFCQVFADKRPKWVASEKDLRKALEALAVAGLIPKLYRLKNKSVLITFKPAELESDVLSILSVAGAKGFTSVAELQTLLGWQKERIELTINSLADQEIAYLDKKENLYYFPAFRK